MMNKPLPLPNMAQDIVTKKEKETKEYGDIYNAILMWRNYIETGDPCMSAETAKRMGQEKSIKYLTPEQKRSVIELEDLANKYFMKDTDVAKSICNVCGSTNTEEFSKLCEEGCPTCGSSQIEIYGDDDEN